ncbi:hypothetical protein GPECTOR_1g563 [Gonium pectorale]|uniref:CBS domain-containing protein n=1 Tax=Gonium pectorale TaxID=33097 RepID=A0A150H3L7_GONPE|nr:hypothetical protein GPECTOR_1g563 [Gonium pectorale]|eukprot:KXZ56625.1 hypothetical protein GPECTOR_1g563 [Gonium pectorale]
MLSTTDRLDEATLRAVLRSGHSRIPVHRAGDRSDVAGLLLVKELLQYRLGSSAAVPVDMLRLRSIPRLPATTPMYDMLRLFQTGRSHIAVLTQPPPGELPRIAAQDPSRSRSFHNPAGRGGGGGKGRGKAPLCRPSGGAMELPGGGGDFTAVAAGVTDADVAREASTSLDGVGLAALVGGAAGGSTAPDDARSVGGETVATADGSSPYGGLYGAMSLSPPGGSGVLCTALDGDEGAATTAAQAPLEGEYDALDGTAAAAAHSAPAENGVREGGGRSGAAWTDAPLEGKLAAPLAVPLALEATAGASPHSAAEDGGETSAEAATASTAPPYSRPPLPPSGGPGHRRSRLGQQADAEVAAATAAVAPPSAAAGSYGGGSAFLHPDAAAAAAVGSPAAAAGSYEERGGGAALDGALTDAASVWAAGAEDEAAEDDVEPEEGRPIGIITIEDVIEELIRAEIVDETDRYVDNLRLVRANPQLLAQSLPEHLARVLARAGAGAGGRAALQRARSFGAGVGAAGGRKAGAGAGAGGSTVQGASPRGSGYSIFGGRGEAGQAGGNALAVPLLQDW